MAGPYTPAESIEQAVHTPSPTSPVTLPTSPIPTSTLWHSHRVGQAHAPLHLLPAPSTATHHVSPSAPVKLRGWQSFIPRREVMNTVGLLQLVQVVGTALRPRLHAQQRAPRYGGHGTCAHQHRGARRNTRASCLDHCSWGRGCARSSLLTRRKPATTTRVCS